jgi:TonB family protein
MIAARVTAETTQAPKIMRLAELQSRPRAFVAGTSYCIALVLLLGNLALGASLPTLNMPNLNSAGGSWVVRFDELHPDPNSSSPLSAPVATLKVDPGYPLQLMRENVAGTVILDAVIHADGTVGNVEVVNSVDPRLDRLASAAVAQWHFQPAMRNGAPVEVEATFQIPFRPLSLDKF